MELATCIWDGFVIPVSMTGLPKTRNTCPWPAERSDAVEWPIAGDGLGFFVTKSTRPSRRRAPDLAFAKLSKTVIPYKSRNWRRRRKLQEPEHGQTGSSSLHNQRACSGVSFSSWHRLQRGSSMIVRRTRKSFVGNALRHVRHKKFFTLFGTRRAQIPFHNFVSGLVCKGDLSNSASSLRNL